jgi:hypothetical protein
MERDEGWKRRRDGQGRGMVREEGGGMVREEGWKERRGGEGGGMWREDVRGVRMNGKEEDE